ncbi:uncharacterized protein TRAVEDRAFT_167175 [Trametes versicolor FP-101664 SS1]|uniref:uncharacterized protein n=1 Tax=Trametes versicolor (strain FP-101664) TaxID=717944 RepID=UPI00046234D9|nr:uncharacterized protein TRAVEDRAFT_167175 [Trametes versicolor FP-101664 SS1]EIW59685.1 hypothetical protein TRAVEDRAFT_167175 [Trametes versicolor FP-101664 SS1]
MATVTHYIYSHYDPPKPKDEENIEETSEKGEEDPWITESTFGARRRIQNPPRFVPAIVSYDEVNNMIGSASSSLPCEVDSPHTTDVSDWYRSLRRASSAPAADPQPPLHPPGHTSVVPPPAVQTQASTIPVAPSVPPLRTRNDWFNSRVVLSEPASPRVPAPTLADILSREPPPERKDQPFVPPVFLHIGPSNRGFTMLQQSGWSEGEALGAGAARRTRLQKAREKKPARTVLDDPQYSVKTEEREIALDGSDDIREVRKVEVVDLTLSDSDDDDLEVLAGTSMASHPTSSAASHNPTALLTPIATVLKSDRLGIGLKAKTVGPFKESKKRVTHNQAALAAHVRANEDMRMRKALLGRGANSFARIAKAEAESRKRLLANLNAD